MVTIEQKLSMFNKLLQRSMDDNFTAEMEYLRGDYSKKLQQGKSAVDKEVKNIEKKAYQRAEKEKAEILNKSTIKQRMDYMSVKEELFSVVLTHFRNRIDEFIQSEQYKAYLISLAKQLKDFEKSSNNIAIFMTQTDFKQYGEDIKHVFPDIFKGGSKIEFADDKIIGGLILINPEANTRIDLSIKTLLEESKPAMMQTFFQALSPVQNEEQ